LDGNTLSLRRLDVDSVRVLATAMGQSVAMDHYGKKVDRMMAEFERLSERLQRARGRFNIPKKELFALVAASNLVMIDVVRSIGLMERSEPAWRDARYDELWETIRRDLELIDRFTTLKMKVGMIQESSQVYLDILNNRRSDLAEFAIIVLLMIEIVVMGIQILVEADAIDHAVIQHPLDHLLSWMPGIAHDDAHVVHQEVSKNDIVRELDDK
jgi:uncharacterized Rmd1/YagE family protein